MAEQPDKKKIRWSAAWDEARELIWAPQMAARGGFGLMLVSRVAGIALPLSQVPG